jgi:hypothetical protein
MEERLLRESERDKLILFTSQSNSDEYIALASASRPALACRRMERWIRCYA